MRLFLITLLLSFAQTMAADEYIDPQTNVIYTYEPGQTTASVKAGYDEIIDRGEDDELESVYHSGCPDATGDVKILDRFTVGTTEYVVTSIGEGAFYENENIKSVNIPETVTDIGIEAFAYCNSLAEVRLPDGLTQIAPSLFRCCYKLESLDIPASVSAIGIYAFADCSSLVSLTLPERLTFVGRFAFYNTPWYAAQYSEAPEGLFYIGSLLFGYKGDKPVGELVIKEGTTCIGFGAFRGCDGLTGITIPGSVTSVDEDAFFECNSLASVISWIEEPFEIDERVFYVNDGRNIRITSATLYVPKGCKARYEATNGWKQFQNIVEMEGRTSDGDLNDDGKVNGTDIQAVINVIVDEEYSEKADFNKDNKVNGTDIQEIINIIVNE